MTLPQEFLDQLKEIFPDKAQAISQALQSTPAAIGVRKNTCKASQWPEEFKIKSPVEWCKSGVRLETRPSFTMLPQWHQGLFYAQEPASMIIENIVDNLFPDKSIPVSMLDSCAAPGGKTTAAINALPEGSLVVANEFSPQRAWILAENIAKCGYPYVIVTQGDTSRFSKLKQRFDLILADVPCSGEGMMRKDEEAVNQWSKGLVAQCASLQKDILSNIVPALKPGGYLIYSTCTFNTLENERQIATLLEEEPELEIANLDLFDENGIFYSRYGILPSLDPSLKAFRFIPPFTDSEGLFITVLKKKGERKETAVPSGKEKSDKKGKSPAKSPSLPLDRLLHSNEDFSIRENEAQIFAVRKKHLKFIDEIGKNIKILSAGILLGEMKGKDFLPSQNLALSTLFKNDCYPRVEIDTKEAILFLARENITLPATAPRGIVLLTYKGYPLGFVKNLGTRCNNLYPKEWRIRNFHN